MRGRLTGLVMALAAGALAPAACGDSRPEPGTDSPAATRERSTTAERPEGGTWDVGASPLPTRADGFGRVLPTPPQLRVRRLPTVERLPDPESDRFESSIRRIGPRIRARMAGTWSRDCPVPLEELRYVTVTFRGFDGEAHTGELVLNARVAPDVASVFRKLYAADFPIETMRLVTGHDLEAPPTGDGNNTAAFVCRRARQQSDWSAHAYGLAVDVNPFHNPYQRSGLVLPELASAYLERDWRRPGMILDGDVVTDAFDDIGWTWGGSWQSTTDYMHFSTTGRQASG